MSKPSTIIKMIFASLGITAIVAYCVYSETNKVAPGMDVALTEEGYICTYDENSDNDNNIQKMTSANLKVCAFLVKKIFDFFAK